MQHALTPDFWTIAQRILIMHTIIPELLGLVVSELAKPGDEVADGDRRTHRAAKICGPLRQASNKTIRHGIDVCSTDTYLSKAIHHAAYSLNFHRGTPRGSLSL